MSRATEIAAKSTAMIVRITLMRSLLKYTQVRNSIDTLWNALPSSSIGVAPCLVNNVACKTEHKRSRTAISRRGEGIPQSCPSNSGASDSARLEWRLGG